MVRCRRMPGCRLLRFGAYVPSRPDGEHCSVVKDRKKGWLGRVGSEKLPFQVATLPAFTDERRDAVRAFHRSLYQRAYAAILALHPQLEGCRQCDGEIFVDG